MITKLYGQWEEANRIFTTMQARWQRAITKAMMQEAHRVRGHIVTNITSGGTHAGQPFAPLSPGTLIVRQYLGLGGSKPLIQTGAMRAAVSVVSMGPNAVFIGIRRTGKGGANLAAIHEYGASYSRQMTDKQRRFLMAAFRSAGGASSPSSVAAIQHCSRCRP